MEKRLFGAVALSAAAGLGLVACGGSSAPKANGSTGSSSSGNTGASSSSTSTTAAGTPFKAQPFTTIVPNGYKDTTAADNSGQSTFLASFTNDSAGSIIQVGKIGSGSSPDTASVASQTAQKFGGTAISQPQSVTVDGESGNFVTFTTTKSGNVYKVQLDVVNHSSNTYQIQYIAPTAQFDGGMSAFQAVVSSWKWT